MDFYRDNDVLIIMINVIYMPSQIGEKVCVSVIELCVSVMLTWIELNNVKLEVKSPCSDSTVYSAFAFMYSLYNEK